MRIGEVVRDQIQCMLDELRSINRVQKRSLEESAAGSSKGVLSNRFTNETVVITASTKVKTACDLQLPSMAPLTSKTSSQVFFLRVLRVIVQIRDAIKKSLKKEQEEKQEEKKEPYVPEPIQRPTKEQLEKRSQQPQLVALSDQLLSLESLWETLSQCLLDLEHTPDHHAVLVLQVSFQSQNSFLHRGILNSINLNVFCLLFQPAVEAFFLVHSPQQGSLYKPTPSQETEPQGASSSQQKTEASDSEQSSSQESEPNSDNSSRSTVPVDHLKFLNFAEKHRTVLNQILRQTTAHLADGPFSVLVDHTRVLDFDVKRRYFRTELERLDQGIRREETAVHVRRSHIFEDSFRELYRRSPEEWKNRFYIVFEGKFLLSTRCGVYFESAFISR